MIIMNKKGFTLTELMIVLVVISGLMYLLIPNASKSKASLQGETCDAYIMLVNSQIESYYLENGEYPEDLQELIEQKFIKYDHCPNGSQLVIDPLNHTAIIKNEEDEE